MDREQIIKALKCCVSADCSECPYHRMPTLKNCIEFNMANVLSLVNELIEGEEKWQEMWADNQSKWEKAYDKLEGEKAKLVEENERLRESECDDCACKLLDERDRAIKETEEIARKMQKKILALSTYGTINISPWQLEQVVKEVLEENK